VLLVAAVASIWPLRHAGTALVVTREIDQPDAIVSLASHEWERLPDAAALGRRAPHAKVVLSQPISLNPYNCHDCGHRVERLVAAGIDARRIELMDRKVYRTLDEAEAFKEWAAPRGVRSVVVVTSPYHTARALASFEHVLKGTGIVVGVHPASASPAELRGPGDPGARSAGRNLNGQEADAAQEAADATAASWLLSAGASFRRAA